jgi:ribosomal peptide maturation radical SAM protein 1
MLNEVQGAGRAGQPKVLLLCMPWATTTRPSIALGILSRLCQEAGVPVRCLYPNMDMVAMVGFEAAGRLANERALYGLSEHLFAVDLFGCEVLCSDEYLRALSIAKVPPPFNDVAYIQRLRDEVIGRFLDQTVERVLAEEPTVVGFTSTFNQVMGSLALARRLKRLLPGVQIIAGGACFDDEMGQEYHRALPGVLDHVFMGEAETSFREYLRRLQAGEPTTGIPGVTDVIEGQLSLVPGKPLQDMNQSPMPDYDDFFREKERHERETGFVFNIEYLPFESSRGCWWGQKNHCIFCGINKELMNFREKDVDRVVSEITRLSARYRAVKLTATDWIISRRSRAAIFERLKELDLDLELFYETRADLRKSEVRLMKDAGVVHIQPGIESLSTELLRLMRKGTTRIRHVQFLRWCREYRVNLSYNLLAGFPGEQPEWYLDMARFLPRIRHLQPPLHNLHFVEMHRFSPLFQRREEFSVDEWQLRADYQFNFPPGLVDPRKIGYFFQFNATTLAETEAYLEQARKPIQEWIDACKANPAPAFHYILGPGFLRITDTRSSQARYLTLADLHQDVLLLCDEVQYLERLKEDLAPLYPAQVADGTLERVVAELQERDLLMSEGGALLTLPIGYKPRTTEELRAYVLGTAPEATRESERAAS